MMDYMNTGYVALIMVAMAFVTMAITIVKGMIDNIEVTSIVKSDEEEEQYLVNKINERKEEIRIKEENELAEILAEIEVAKAIKAEEKRVREHKIRMAKLRAELDELNGVTVVDTEEISTKQMIIDARKELAKVSK